MDRLNRRQFLENSMWAAAVAAGSGPLAASAEAGRRTGANETLNVGVVGIRSRGGNHISAYSGMKDVTIRSLCDVDENVLYSRAQQIEKKTGQKPKMYTDFREMVQDKDLDAVSIATTNHWHSLHAIWAIQAGKHVYVEKPVSHNVFEGAQVVKAARKYNKIVQTGTQCRSSRGLHDAMDFMWSGKIGKLKIARGLCYKPRGSIGFKPHEKPPAHLKWDLWLGPAPEQPYHANLVHYNWHWFWDFGCGDLGNQGIHQVDIARWGLKRDVFPSKVHSIGGRLGYKDQAQTANTQTTWYDYGDQQLIFEVRGLKTGAQKGAKIGVIFECEDGYIVNPSYTSATAFDKDGRKVQSWKAGGDHFRNFVNAVKSGKKEDLAADIREGHVSSAMCHLANVSLRLGKQVSLAKNDPFGDLADANKTFVAMRDHLRDNKVDPAASTISGGRVLEFDTKAETFVGDREAIAMMTRDYRKPYVVPKEV